MLECCPLINLRPFADSSGNGSKPIVRILKSIQNVGWTRNHSLLYQTSNTSIPTGKKNITLMSSLFVFLKEAGRVHRWYK